MLGVGPGHRKHRLMMDSARLKASGISVTLSFTDIVLLGNTNKV